MTMKVLDKGKEYPSEVEIGSGMLWLPYKNILEVVNRAISENTTDAYAELDMCAKKRKSDFVNFLNFPRKSATDREIIKKSTAEGIFLKGQDSKQLLHQQLVNETLLLSDIFDINEFLALDLLATAETLKEEYPGWTRGLIAIALFYEGRLCMIQTVSAMVTAIPGLTWHHEDCFPRVHATFKTLLGYTFKNDMIDNLIELYDKSGVKAQLDVLESNLALGDWRHRLEINRMLIGIREGISFILFAVSAQEDLTWKETLRILEYFKNNLKIDDACYTLDKAQILLVATILFSLTNSLNFGTYDRQFAKDFLKYLKEHESKTHLEGGFYCQEIFEFFRLVFHIYAHKAVSETNMNSLHSGYGAAAEVIKDEEDFFFKNDVFAFLRDRIFSNPIGTKYEGNIARKYHQVLTDFISFMPSKLKEMKVRSEDAAKTAALYQNQGFLRPPNLPQDYESFLECLGQFYLNSEENLSVDFFDPEVRNLSLNKLARGACVDTSSMFVPNARFLIGLAKRSPEDVCDLLKQNGHNFSLEHFFESIMLYLSSFGTNTQNNFIGHNGTNLFASETFQRVVSDPVRFSMNPAEVLGILSYLDLVKTVSENSIKISSYFSILKRPWIRVLLDTAKIRAIPRDLRSKMLGTASAMICEQSSGEIITNLWDLFYSIRLIGQDNGDLKDELEEHESRYELYPLTIGMLKLLDALINARFKQLENDASHALNGVGNMDNGGFDPYVTYVRDNVLLRAAFRSYKNLEERWEISSLTLEILSKLLDYVPQLMYQLLCGSPFLRTILATLNECVNAREGSAETMKLVDRCSLACLNILRRALQRQSYFLHTRELSTHRQEAVIVGMQEFLMRILPETGRPEYIISILKFIDTLQPPTHKQAALDILWLTLADRDDIDAHLYAAIITDTNLVALLRYMFINILYESSEFNEMRKAVLQIIRVSVVHSSPNFAMMLLGVDKKVDFQNAGVAGYPRTVLHAIIDNTTNLPDAFCTLLTLMRDSRLWQPLLRYFKTIHFFSNFLKESFPSPTMEVQDIGYLLKCIAVELKTTSTPGVLAQTLIGEVSSKFQEVLNLVDLDDEPLDIPDLEFLDPKHVMQAMKTCEYYDPKLKINVIRIDMLENLLKEEMTKLEKTTVLKLRNSIHSETQDVVKFAIEFNESRWKEASKINMFDGWRQCLEVLVLSPETLDLAGVDFVTTILRVILSKVVGVSSPREYFCRLTADTVLTLSAVMGTFKDQVNSTTINLILSHVCKWIAEEQSSRVRATLYASVLHIVRMYKSPNDAGSSTVASFALMLDNLCKDCCQSKEIGKIQALYMMGEIIRLTADRGLIGQEHFSQSSKQNNSGISLNSSVSFRRDSRYEPSIKTQEPIHDGCGDASRGDYSTTTTTPKNKTFATTTTTPSKSATKSTVRVDVAPSHLNILSYMFAKGFIGNIVEALLTVDDGDLVKLFSNQPLNENMKSLYVFEAKISLLCRFSSTGKRAILFMMDTNVVRKLADLRVLQIQYFQEDTNLYSEMGGSRSHNITNMSIVAATQIPTRKEIMNILFTGVLKLMHSMVDASPKDVLLVEQVWHFLTVHDLALSNLLSKAIIENEDNNVGCSLLLALLAKIAKLLPLEAYTGRTNIMLRVVDILKLQAVHPAYSNFRIKTVTQVLLFLHNYSHNAEIVHELKQQGSGVQKFRLVLNNRLAHDLLTGNPEESLTLGVVVKIISDVAGLIIGSDLGVSMTQPKLESAVGILEIGFNMIHQHIEVFIFGNEYKNHAQSFCQDFIPLLDNNLSKHGADAAKAIGKADFIEMLILRIRRMVHAPSKA